MTPPRTPEDYANDAVGWIVATHPWASGAFTAVVEAIRGYAAEQVAQARKEDTDRLAHAVFWLLRAYDSGHRQGWEPGPSTEETMDGLFTWLCNEGFDPNVKATPQFVPEIAAAIRWRSEG